MAQPENHHHHPTDISSPSHSYYNDDEEEEDEGVEQVEKIKTLLSAISLVSRNLPLPHHLLHNITCIYHHSPSCRRQQQHHLDDEDEVPQKKNCYTYDIQANGTVHAALQNGHVYDGRTTPREDFHATRIQETGIEISTAGGLFRNFEDAIARQRMNFVSGVALRKAKEDRMTSYLRHRLTELQELPLKMGDNLQMKCLLELYGIKLADLQKKVRSEVSAEYHLREECANPEKQLFDWGHMRLRRTLPLFGMGDAPATEADERLRRRRDAERQTRLEEEERNRVETKKRKFFNELLNAAREFQLQGQAL